MRIGEQNFFNFFHFNIVLYSQFLNELVFPNDAVDVHDVAPWKIIHPSKTNSSLIEDKTDC